MTPKKKTQKQAAICKRYESLAKMRDYLPHLSRIHLMMNLHYADKSIPLDFDKLLAAPEADFLHDLLGIDRHMDKKQAVLGGCFVPRSAAYDKEVPCGA